MPQQEDDDLEDRKKEKGLKKIATGLPGLDDILDGGFIKGNSILVCGPPGAGKTTLAFQFLCEGAKREEPGAYISFDEDGSKLLANMSSFGWDLEGLLKQDMLRIQKVGALEIQQFASQESILLVEIIRSIGAKRVVVDSLTSYELLFKMDYERMIYIKRLIEEIVNRGCTMLAISEAPQGTLSRFSLAEFIFDTVIDLQPNKQFKTNRALEIVKNRGSAPSLARSRWTSQRTESPSHPAKSPRAGSLENNTGRSCIPPGHWRDRSPCLQPLTGNGKKRARGDSGYNLNKRRPELGDAG
ncbi:MAG: ATPase domain-containing protein [Candidatus Micrarchaeota archaeon]